MQNVAIITSFVFLIVIPFLRRNRKFSAHFQPYYILTFHIALRAQELPLFCCTFARLLYLIGISEFFDEDFAFSQSAI